MKINKAKSRILMFAGSLPKLVRIFMAVGVLSVVSNVAEAATFNDPIFSASPNMYSSNRIEQLKSNTGIFIPLHNVGPGGQTLYAKDAYIKDFIFEGFSVDGGNGIETYSATLTARMFDANGNDTHSSMTLFSNSLFRVQFDGRTDQTTPGEFNTHLLEATFNGLTYDGDPLKIYLTNIPTALSKIEAVSGGYNLSTALFPSVLARSEINQIVVGDMDLYKVDEPEIALLLLPALLLIGAKRRRLAVLAV